MGGYGSGWQGGKKATVEGSLVLTAAALVRKKALVEHGPPAPQVKGLFMARGDFRDICADLPKTKR